MRNLSLAVLALGFLACRHSSDVEVVGPRPVMVSVEASGAGPVALDGTGHEGVRHEACPPGESCKFGCDGGNCEFGCAGGAHCSADCDGGNCLFECVGGSTCDFECDGDNCTTRCEPGSHCDIECDGGGCH
jgi:hypothetical protein